MAAWILIMAGGGGTRLWPMSRRSLPKQFLPLLEGGATLLGATVERLLGLVPIERILVVTAASQAADVRRVVPTLPPGNLIVEPQGRNTAPCIGLGALAIARRDPQAVMAVLPSDHFIANPAAFLDAMRHALAHAARGHVVTIGIRPTRPETGYGYIERGARLAGSDDPGETYSVERFVEKPDRLTAEGYVLGGRHYWNAGMFFLPAQRALDELGHALPALGAILAAIDRAPEQIDVLYPQAPAISIDYAVMERLPARGGLLVVPGDFGWSDVGSWDALAGLLPGDDRGNTILGEAVAVDADHNILVGDQLIAAVGVRDLIIVASRGAVLVLPRSRAQDVRNVVATLESTQRDSLL